LALAGFARGAAAQTDTLCAPACAAGETCVNGVCMVPARPAPATAPAPAAAPAAPAAVAPVPAPARQATDAEVARSAPLPAAHAVAVAPPPRHREGMLILPFLGLHSFQDSNASGLDAGLRVGSFVGGFINNSWSMNGAAELDILNFNNDGGVDGSGQMLAVTFDPLLHLGSEKIELVLGPKLGGWALREHIDINDPVSGVSGSGDATAEGWTIGGNMGLFVAVSPTVLAGVLMSLEVRDVLHSCASVTVGTQAVDQCKSSGDSNTILGFTFGLML
jgi:hypothetical protein